MGGTLVQSKRTPPVLIPLSRPLTRSKREIAQRIDLIHKYAERYRELDPSEVRELFDLKHLLIHGTLPVGKQRARRPEAELLADLLA